MNDLLARINAFRAQAQTCGGGTPFPAAAALRWNNALAQAAARHSGDMALNNFFDHTGSDGSEFDQRISATGYRWTVIAENIAAGQASSASAFTAWRNSPGHCSAMMSARLTEIGGSCVQRAGTAFRYYWTIDLGRPR